MSVAGLRFSRGAGSRTTLETRSGSYIYDGNPSTFRDWEFRTSMRLKLYEDAIRAKTRSTSANKSDKSVDLDDAESEVEAASPTGTAATPVRTGPLRHAQKAANLPPRKSEDAGSVKTVSSTLPTDESTAYACAVKARTEMAHRVLEGLREEAFGLRACTGYRHRIPHCTWWSPCLHRQDA